jgi:CRP-like cAMP-binding protein
MQIEANGLLAELVPEERARLEPHLQARQLAAGDYVYVPGGKMLMAYFPGDCLISILHVLKNGTSTEMAVVGREGFFGVPLVMGGNSTQSGGLVQVPGTAWTLPAEIVQLEFARRGPFSRRVLLYAQALMTQMGLTAVCNRHHTLPQQLSRWLLLRLDRIGSLRLETTHELIANMLGVHRGGVTEAALRLQADGLIRYSRGRIEVLDRVGLERRCCECYSAVRHEYLRLLGAGALTVQAQKPG